jgi:hypothetical protein
MLSAFRRGAACGRYRAYSERLTRFASHRENRKYQEFSFDDELSLSGIFEYVVMISKFTSEN